MGHAHGDVLDAMVDGSVNKSLHARNKGLTTFKSKTFFVGIFAGNEFFERFGPYQPIKYHSLFVDGIVPRLGSLNSFTNPVTLLLVRNVNILDTNSAA
jgi:hypothetical protein